MQRLRPATIEATKGIDRPGAMARRRRHKVMKKGSAPSGGRRDKF